MTVEGPGLENVYKDLLSIFVTRTPFSNLVDFRETEGGGDSPDGTDTVVFRVSPETRVETGKW